MRNSAFYVLIVCFLAGISTVGAQSAPSLPTGEDAETLWQQVVAHDDHSKIAGKKLAQLSSLAVPVLLLHLDDSRWKDRWDAVNLLGIIGDRQATDPLIERVLTDPNPHVRWRSLWALSALNNPDVPVKFWSALQRENDETVRWNAVVGLGFFGETECLPYLEQGLSRDDSWERWEAIYSLRRIHGKGTAKLLIPMLQGEEDRIRREIVMTLIHIDGPFANATLVDLLEDASPEIRWRAAMGLARNQVEGAQVLLEQRLDIETEVRVREEIEKALTGLDKKQ